MLQHYLTSAQSLLLLAGFIGMVLPPIISIVQQDHWPSGIKAIVTVVLILIASWALVDTKGLWHGWDWPSIDAEGTAFLAMLLTTYGTLTKFWQQLFGGRLLDWIEHNTTLATLFAAVKVWWQSNHAAVLGDLSPELLARAKALLEAEKAAAEQARVATAISPPAAVPAPLVTAGATPAVPPGQ